MFPPTPGSDPRTGPEGPMPPPGWSPNPMTAPPPPPPPPPLDPFYTSSTPGTPPPTPPPTGFAALPPEAQAMLSSYNFPVVEGGNPDPLVLNAWWNTLDPTAQKEVDEMLRFYGAGPTSGNSWVGVFPGADPYESMRPVPPPTPEAQYPSPWSAPQPTQQTPAQGWMPRISPPNMGGWSKPAISPWAQGPTAPQGYQPPSPSGGSIRGQMAGQASAQYPRSTMGGPTSGSRYSGPMGALNGLVRMR